MLFAKYICSCPLMLRCYRTTLKKLYSTNVKSPLSANVIDTIISNFDVVDTSIKKLTASVDQQLQDYECIETLDHLKLIHVTFEHIKKMPWIFNLHLDELNSKLEYILSNLFFTKPIDALGLCYFSHQYLHKINLSFGRDFPLVVDYGNRLYYICQELGMRIDMFCLNVARSPYVLYREFEQIRNMLNVLKEFEILPEYIESDPWIFYHNCEFVKDRFSHLSQLGCRHPPVWAGHCSNEHFNRLCELKRKENYILMYLKDNEGIDVDMSEMKQFLSYFRKYPNIKETFKVLRRHHLSNEQIKSILPKLYTNPKNLEKKLEFIATRNCKLEDILHIFDTSLSQFKHHVRNILDSNYEERFKDKFEFLQQYLDFESDPETKLYLQKHPMLRDKSKSISELKTMIDTYRELGLTNHDIRDKLYLLRYSINRIQKRGNKMLSLNQKMTTYHISLKQDKFDDYIKKMQQQ